MGIKQLYFRIDVNRDKRYYEISISNDHKLNGGDDVASALEKKGVRAWKGAHGFSSRVWV